MITNQTKLEFGTGDICISSGIMGDRGMVTFSNQSPREIAKNNGDIKVGRNYSLDDFPVVMTFTKVKSIDMLIHALEEVKELMKDED